MARREYNLDLFQNKRKRDENIVKNDGAIYQLCRLFLTMGADVLACCIPKRGEATKEFRDFLPRTVII